MNGNKKLTKKEVKRLCKKLDKLPDQFELIDEQVDASLKVSPETLKKAMDL